MGLLIDSDEVREALQRWQANSYDSGSQDDGEWHPSGEDMRRKDAATLANVVAWMADVLKGRSNP